MSDYIPSSRERRVIVDSIADALHAVPTELSPDRTGLPLAQTVWWSRFFYTVLRGPWMGQRFSTPDGDGYLTNRGRTISMFDLVVSEKPIQVSAKNPRLISVWRNDRESAARPSKFFRKVFRDLVTANDIDLEIPERWMEMFLEWFGEQLPSKWGFDLQVISGEAIEAAYDAPSSCMTGSDALNFYMKNPETLRLLQILRGGVPFGRALLWTLVDGSVFIDRVYPSDNAAHTELINKYVKDNNITTRGANRAGDVRVDRGIITAPFNSPNDSWASNHSRGGFPYLDTFSVMKHNPDKSKVMLGYFPNGSPDGWVSVGNISRAYQEREYCRITRGWMPTEGLVRVMAYGEDNQPEVGEREWVNRAAAGRAGYILVKDADGELAMVPRGTNQIGTHPKGHLIRLSDETVKVEVGGKTRHATKEETYAMHDGTHLYRNAENLRKIVKLPSGLYATKEDTQLNPDKGEHEVV